MCGVRWINHIKEIYCSKLPIRIYADHSKGIVCKINKLLNVKDAIDFLLSGLEGNTQELKLRFPYTASS
jgi:hypothetical protein